MTIVKDESPGAEALRHVLDALGITWILGEVADSVRTAREKEHTDDVAIVIDVDIRDPKVATFIAYLRTDLIDGAKKEGWPRAVRLLEQVFSAHEVPVLIIYDEIVYSLVYDLKGLDAGAMS